MDTTADATAQWRSAFGHRYVTLVKVLLIFNFVFFIFCIASWLGWLPVARGFQPLQMVYFSGALVLPPVAWLIVRRSMLACIALLAAAIVLLVVSTTVRDGRDLVLREAPVTGGESTPR